MNILTTAQLVIHSCLARKSSSRELAFNRLDYPELDPPDWTRFVTVRRDADDQVQSGTVPLDYYGNLPETYERENRDYIESRGLKHHRRAS